MLRITSAIQGNSCTNSTRNLEKLKLYKQYMNLEKEKLYEQHIKPKKVKVVQTLNSTGNL